jgi:ubiquinone/menaquinone biosynthesis C-methylase UbiE
MNHGMLEARYTHGELVRKYNRIASVYDLFGIFMASKARQRALEMASIQNGENVLEVALGTGLNFAEILKRNPHGWVHGIDVSKKMLERTRKRISKIEHGHVALHLCDCRHLPFEDGAFDIVINEYMLDILPVEDFNPILNEFKRVLRPGGRIILVNTTYGERWINRIYELLYKLRPPIVAGSRGVRAQPFLEEVGFTGIRREYISQFGFPSETVQGFKR